MPRILLDLGQQYHSVLKDYLYLPYDLEKTLSILFPGEKTRTFGQYINIIIWCTGSCK